MAVRSRNRAVQWVVAWLIVGILLGGGFAAAVYSEQLLAAAGLTRSGAPSTIDPELFAPEPTPTADAPTPAGTGLAAAAALPEPGPLPDRLVLEERLNSLDRSELVAQEGATVAIAYEVVDVATGEIVAANGQDLPLIPASNTKTLTALAVMNAFDGSETFATRVLQPAAGQVVLVGGGDPLLRSTPADAGYPQPASTAELAAATAEALLASGQTSVTLGYDASLFTDPGWNATWPDNYRDQVTQLSSLWVDEGRGPDGGPRSRNPALSAAETFAAQLTAAGVAVAGEPTAVPASGAEVARVESLPVHVLVETAMTRSNNSFTEVLGFQLALQTGHPATFEGSVAAIEEQLTALGLWRQGAVLYDASGLSRSNLVTAGMLAEAVRAMASEPRLSVILDGLPTAGVTGTLADRFADDVSSPARGVARAKTGTLSFVSTLAGTTLTADGRLVAFAFIINGPPNGWAARVWADQAAGVVAACGC
ncbi:D-alanyl-D-alanine carboxypeptidase/D-alanyl-D-alanine endopeptidase [Tessaracoccus flavus]|uniref:D-alanyl-D-alanine carboxypeptidase/D-alanyl-D-alanine-endopeptidase n=1 Tax=Tessaracoccus flavus TaxID=1610493 RepID=A0A1Q2CC18_9ACTN|nr:D-alanyl-D-alanine carboxypeptidase/D-alanyl-D-alanine-endopeptidase [Tessaracoccus flavus]AQP43658.1 D-alanyl-D-alanine carboxypeptidase/D-alanyl-D-alanine-endopeptidase [Tessaracoccus flavus]